MVAAVCQCVCRHYGERLYADLVAEADDAFADMRNSVCGGGAVAAGTLDEASLLSFDHALRQVRQEHTVYIYIRSGPCLTLLWLCMKPIR